MLNTRRGIYNQQFNKRKMKKKKPPMGEYQSILDKHKKYFFDNWSMKWRDNASLKDFERLRTLGTGAFGRVVLVKKKSDSTYYAMKILKKSEIVRKNQLDHTSNEIRVLHSIKFPFVVFMKFYFKDNTYIYMVLPFIDGGEMFTHLRKMGHFEESLAKFYAAQVVLAIEFLHYCNLIYRDLKPENILIKCNGYIKLTDFGFCKMIDGRTWTLCGTPEYLAPEIILSKGYNKSVDWWSFGVLVYEMNAGYSPFDSPDHMKIYEKIIAGKFKFARHFDPQLKDIIDNLLQVDITRRFGNLKNGTADIKNHRWFRTIDWLQIYDQKIQPSFLPECKGLGDTSNFDIYDEEIHQIEPIDRYAEEFADF